MKFKFDPNKYLMMILAIVLTNYLYVPHWSRWIGLTGYALIGWYWR